MLYITNMQSKFGSVNVVELSILIFNSPVRIMCPRVRVCVFLIFYNTSNQAVSLPKLLTPLKKGILINYIEVKKYNNNNNEIKKKRLISP